MNFVAHIVAAQADPEASTASLLSDASPDEVSPGGDRILASVIGASA